MAGDGQFGVDGCVLGDEAGLGQVAGTGGAKSVHVAGWSADQAPGTAGQLRLHPQDLAELRVVRRRVSSRPPRG
ncbi:hypothetical protein [Streptomyces sp. NPDC057557]|uniref:hypothetical protein n=1 Tax=Streptomyces sp. NPDC057557 TaxID=3346167 RepID=UPI0036C12C44